VLRRPVELARVELPFGGADSQLICGDATMAPWLP